MSNYLDLRISETDLANIRELLSRSPSKATIKTDSKALPRVAGRTPVVAFKKLVIEGLPAETITNASIVIGYGPVHRRINLKYEPWTSRWIYRGNVEIWLDEDSEDIPNVSFDLWCTRRRFMLLEKAYNVAALRVDVDQLKALEESFVSALALKASKMPLKANTKLSAVQPKGAEKSDNVFLSIEVERQFEINIELRKNAFVGILPSFN